MRTGVRARNQCRLFRETDTLRSFGLGSPLAVQECTATRLTRLCHWHRRRRFLRGRRCHRYRSRSCSSSRPSSQILAQPSTTPGQPCFSRWAAGRAHRRFKFCHLFVPAGVTLNSPAKACMLRTQSSTSSTHTLCLAVVAAGGVAAIHATHRLLRSEGTI
jgi:hypothetical protein